MFSIVWKLIILYLCESNIEFYMRVKEIPILLLTGYLGSGKTTLVNHILSNKRGIKFAVIVNDIGEVNIDADLIQKGGIVGKKDESLVALQNGCICCTLKMDLVEQIDDIMKQERFDYIVIEASGVCEPAPIAQTICSISSMGNTYGGCRLDCIVTVVDALRLQSEFSCGNDLTCKGIDEEDIENLIIQQIEFCNVVLLNKASEVKRDELERIKQIIRTLQPAAEIIECDYADADLDKIIYTEAFDFERTATSAGWIRGIESALTEEQKKEAEEHEHHHHDHDGECGCHHEHGHHHADDVFNSWGTETPHKYDREEIEAILKRLVETEEFGVILRAKGMVPDKNGSWIYFDAVPGEYELRDGQPEYTGKLCVIGTNVEPEKMEELFLLK